MKVAILDPFSGISGDMTLGALLDVGLDADWLRALPASLGLEGVGVRIADVTRGTGDRFESMRPGYAARVQGVHRFSEILCRSCACVTPTASGPIKVKKKGRSMRPF